jgi:flagellar biogenesis protein FliO
MSMLFALIGTGCIILLTYYASRWYAKKMGPVAGGKFIKVLDRVVVSKASSILIVEIQEKQYVLGISEQNVQVLMDIEKKITPEFESEMTKVNFQGIMKNLNKWKGAE